MNNSERIDNLREAQDLLEQAMELVREATEGTSSQDYAEARIFPQIRFLIHGGNYSGHIEALIADFDYTTDAEDVAADYDDTQAPELAYPNPVTNQVPATNQVTVVDREVWELVRVEDSTLANCRRYRETVPGVPLPDMASEVRQVMAWKQSDDLS